jgi:GT2 family glycosyltransferase
MANQMIYLVIPVFNRLNYTIDCIESLQKQSYADFSIVVVDDGSTDGTYEYIRKNYPAVTILKGDGNLWWTGAINMGVKYVLSNGASEKDFVLTLNNDLVVPVDYLEKLLENYGQNSPCLVGSVSVDIHNPENVDYCGVKWDKFSAKQRPAIKLPIRLHELQSVSQTVETDLLPGRGVLIPVSVFGKIGLYDLVSFPHYAADEDFSLRAKNEGYRLVISSKAYVMSYIRESNLNGKHTNKNLRYWYDYFFSIKSSCNLKYRYRWARKHAKYPIIYFAFDFSRICIAPFRSQN